MRKIIQTLLIVLTVLTINISLAQAHSSAPLNITPSENSENNELPTEISLTFAENLIQSGAAISVLDPNGEQVAEGLPIVQGQTLNAQTTPSGAKGQYKITYRVTSEDGAVNQGQYFIYVTQETADLRNSETTTSNTETSNTAINNNKPMNEQGNSDNLLSVILLASGVLLLIYGTSGYYNKGRKPK